MCDFYHIWVLHVQLNFQLDRVYFTCTWRHPSSKCPILTVFGHSVTELKWKNLFWSIWMVIMKICAHVAYMYVYAGLKKLPLFFFLENNWDTMGGGILNTDIKHLQTSPVIGLNTPYISVQPDYWSSHFLTFLRNFFKGSETDNCVKKRYGTRGKFQVSPKMLTPFLNIMYLV